MLKNQQTIKRFSESVKFKVNGTAKVAGMFLRPAIVSKRNHPYATINIKVWTDGDAPSEVYSKTIYDSVEVPYLPMGTYKQPRLTQFIEQTPHFSK